MDPPPPHPQSDHQPPSPLPIPDSTTQTHQSSPSKSPKTPQKSVSWSPNLTTEATIRDSNTKNTMDTVRDVFGRWRQKVGEATKKAEDLAGNVWQHLKTGPSVTDAAMGRIAQGTKVLAEVMGILYLSTAKLAFCSDNPLPYKVGDQTEWSYYKVILPLHQLKAVNPSASKVNSSEKYIQVISVDSHEFWFMGFVNYDGAVINLREALEGHSSQTM
ncbi:hypothetical protein MRB53_033585 [Persea americana]|uniref:Uncharacterized protein n=1 Tax=Persea americana TaxID=3435 RepID=A0ACC2KVS0_PERAE|nr:hypothetical protein MRB53_033585 [Persea americana]